MTKQSPKIIFFGNERLATGVTTTCPVLTGLLQAGYNVCAVVLHNEKATSRTKRMLEIAELAKLNNIPVLYPVNLKLAAKELAGIKADIGVLAAFGKIVPESIINLFPKGIINVHPSALPKHRGSTPIESVLLGGETETAVSIMKLAAEMDAGPLYAQRIIPVPGKISKQALADSLSEIGSKMIVQHLPAILDGGDGRIEPKLQDHSRATYDPLITKTGGQLDWTKTAGQLEREIRAFRAWPKSNATLGHHQVIITDVDVVLTSDETLKAITSPGSYAATKKALLVRCGKDWLSIRRIQPVNKKEMPVEAFLAGYPL